MKNKKDYRTLNKLKKLIKSNFISGEDIKNQLFVTLTYKGVMEDTERAYKDFVLFWKRLTYKLKCYDLAYISIIELQKRNTYHFHVLIKSDKDFILLPSDEAEQCWGNGITYTEYFTDIEPMHSYLIKDLNNLPKRTNGYRYSRNLNK